MMITGKSTETRKSERGFSLVELLSVMVILLTLITAVGMVVTAIQSSYSQRKIRNEQFTDGVGAINLMTTVMRAAGANTDLQAITPGGAANIRLRSDWNPADGNLSGQYEDISFYQAGNSLVMRNEASGAESTLLTEVSNLTFEYRDGSGATTGVPADISYVKVSFQTGAQFPRAFTSTIYIRKKTVIE
jgi:prepilin-type N-terminal cleavage/methylation domain-containing protein